MPPDLFRFQKATQDFQSARLFDAAEPLLEAIIDEFMILYSR